MLRVSNFQKQAWQNFFAKEIYNVFERAGFTDRLIRVKYTPSNPDKFRNFSSYSVRLGETLQEVLKVDINIVDLSDDSNSQSTASNLVFRNIPLVTVPLLTDFGFIIRGTKKGVISKLRPASGWYLTPTSKGPTLVLQAGAYSQITIRVAKPTASNVPKTILERKVGNERQSLPIFVVLKALSSYSTFEDILADLKYNSHAMADYMAVSSEEPNMEECAREVLKCLFRDSGQYSDPVKRLHEKFYTQNYLHIGKEHKPRFENFVSYLKIVGYPLAEDITIETDKGSQVFQSGTIVTTDIATQLDDSGLESVSINLDGHILPVIKCECKDELTYRELITAVYHFYLKLDGVGSYDSQDNYCNRVLDSVAFKYERYISDTLETLSSYIQGRLVKGGNLEQIIEADKLADKLSHINIHKYIGEDETYQQYDETNSLSSFEQSFRISAGGEHASIEQRDVQKSQYGRTDAFTTSESKKVGLNLSLTTMAGVDEYGFITTPVYPVVNGIVDKSKVIDLSAIAERGKAIAPQDVDLEALYQKDPNSLVLCRLDGVDVQVSLQTVKYQYIVSCQSLGPLMSMIPAGNHDAGKRSTMAGNAQKQALPVLRRERPIVCTGTEAIMDIGITRARDIIESSLAKLELFDLTGIEDAVLTVEDIHPDGNMSVIEFTTTLPQLPGKHEYAIPRLHSTIKGSMEHYRVRLSKDGKYAADDIVVYANDIDIGHYKLNKPTVNLGGICKDSSVLENRALALGSNVKILFASYEGGGYEDSVIVNKDFVTRYGLAIPKVNFRIINLETDEVAGVKISQQFTKDIDELSDVEKSYLDSNGLPREGTRLKSGQVIAGRIRIEEGKDGIKKSTNACARMDVDESGIIISTRLTPQGDKAEITFGSIETLDSGDKVSGYHGNKGVVSRIVRSEDMPFTKDGTPDLIINPLGVPARENLGQIIEAALGMYGFKTGEIQILEPFSDIDPEALMEKLKAAGVCETDVYDGRTGLKYPRKAMMGIMHFVRSEHVSLSKYNACASANDKISPRTNQPTKSRGGGQKYSELTTWCLNSYGATNIMDTLFTLQSDDIASLNEYLKHVRTSTNWSDVSDRYVSYNPDLMQVYLRTLGCNIFKNGDTSKIQILTDRQERAIAHRKCNLQYPDIRSILRDPEVFGTVTNHAPSYTKSRQWYGYIPVAFPFIQPVILTNSNFLKMFFIRKPDGQVGYMTLNTYKGFMDKTMHYIGNEPDTGLPIVIKLAARTTRNEEDTGITGLMHLVSSYDFKTTTQQINSDLGIEKDLLDFDGNIDLVDSEDDRAGRIIDGVFYATTTEEHIKSLRIRSTVKMFLSEYTIEKITVNGILVPPIGYRPLIRKRSSSAFDIQIGDVVRQLQILSKFIVGSDEWYSRCNEVYKAIAAFIQHDGVDKHKKSIIQEFLEHDTKNSIVRDSVLSKRLRYSGRSVIIVDSTLKIDECGIPVVMAAKIFEDHLVSMLINGVPGKYLTLERYGRGDSRLIKRMISYVSFQNYRGFAALLSTTRNIYADFRRCKAELTAMLEELFEYFYCMLNREPSLHKFSVTGFKAKPVWSNAIALHPLACHGFNADFDGDQMSVTFLIHPRAQAELKQIMLMSQNLINPKDGKLITSLNQDMILGMYWATMFTDNRESVSREEMQKYVSVVAMASCEPVFNGQFNAALVELWSQVNSGGIKVQDPVLVSAPNGRLYNSTAGRVLFNSLFPNLIGFTDEKIDGTPFYRLRFDTVLKKSSLEGVLQWAVQYYNTYTGNDTLAMLLDRLKDFGFLMADKSAVSISFFDFAEVSTFTTISEKLTDVQERVRRINDYASGGFITETERRNLVIDEWIKLRDIHVQGILDSLDRNSNLFMMIDSSARGDVHQLMEMCGIVGNVSNAKGNILETPILSNYFRGLTPQDLHASSYKARNAICAAQLSTANVGEMNRNLIYAVEHHYTRNSTTNCSATPTKIKLEYVLKTDIPTYYKIATENLDSLPNELFGNGLTRERWEQFAQFVANSARTAYCYASIKALIETCKLPRAIFLNGDEKLEVVDLSYRLTSSCRAMLWYRAFEPDAIVTDRLNEYKKSGLKYIQPGKDPLLSIVGDATLKLIEEDVLDEFPIYTIIGCKSTSGVCRRCFGLKYDTSRLPDQEEYIGYQAIQAIGEPTQQLVLDTHKRSGSKNKSSARGIQPILNKPCDRPMGYHALVAPKSGILHVTGKELTSLHLAVDDVVVPKCSGFDIKVADLKFIDGDYVRSGDVLTHGTVYYPQMIKTADYRDVQVEFWKAFIQLYEGENIMARNFELLALSQTEFGVAKEDFEDIFAGKIYPIKYLNTAHVDYIPEILDLDSAMVNRGKVYTSTFHSFTLDRLGLFAVQGTNNIEESNIGRTILGELRSKSTDKQVGIVKESRAELLERASDTAGVEQAKLPYTSKSSFSKPGYSIPLEINSLSDTSEQPYAMVVDAISGELIREEFGIERSKSAEETAVFSDDSESSLENSEFSDADEFEYSDDLGEYTDEMPDEDSEGLLPEDSDEESDDRKGKKDRKDYTTNVFAV